MAIKNTQNGFALLVAVIFMSVMLALGLGLSSLSYKQQLLASTAIASQYAFYAADAGMECALYDDQQLNSFDYATHNCNNSIPVLTTCDGTQATQLACDYDMSRLSFTQRMSLDSDKHCADVTIYKYNNATTTIFSQGYDVSCDKIEDPSSGARFVSRGESISY